MTTRTPKWAVGMRKLAPGAYISADGGLHFSTREMCEAFGVPASEENQRIARETTMQSLREAGLDRVPGNGGDEPMSTILELAFWRVRQNGMAEATAVQMLETFARTTSGQTLDWGGLAPRLTNEQGELIDHAAVAYLNARGLYASVPEPPVEREVRDGKMLATGEGA